MPWYYRACLNAEKNRPEAGNVGAGTGAAVVNAYGDVFDYESGEKLAGMVNEERTNFVSAESVLCKKQTEGIELKNEDGANTTLGVVLTNGTFSTGRTKCNINVAGVLGARVLGKAIGEAVKNSVMPEEEFLAKMMRIK